MEKMIKCNQCEIIVAEIVTKTLRYSTKNMQYDDIWYDKEDKEILCASCYCDSKDKQCYEYREIGE